MFLKNDKEAKVMVYNDDKNTFSNVIKLLSKNTHNDPVEAFLLAQGIHEEGKMSVYEGELDIAKKVSKQLKSGGLHSEVIKKE